MAMLRLPTKESGGRANLHQGAIGVGIDIATGITRGGVKGSSPVALHPDTEKSVREVQIPYWDKILDISLKAYDVFELGYFGIDVVLDSKLGPLVLEANARPGLAIQLANGIGLKARIDFVKENSLKLTDFEARQKLISDIPEIRR